MDAVAIIVGAPLVAIWLVGLAFSGYRWVVSRKQARERVARSLGLAQGVHRG